MKQEVGDLTVKNGRIMDQLAFQSTDTMLNACHLSDVRRRNTSFYFGLQKVRHAQKQATHKMDSRVTGEWMFILTAIVIVRVNIDKN